MKRRGLGAIVGCVAILTLLAAQPAGAATQVGNSCVASTATPGSTIVSLANGAGNPFPATIPSAGVITRWSFSHALELPPGVLTQVLKVLRPSGAPKQFQVVAETSSVLTGAVTSSPARIPVQAGDHIATIGRATAEPNTLVSIYCFGASAGDLAGAILGSPPPGAFVALTGEGNAQIPVIVTVEPDADNDGFGDETQDGCPQSPLVQGACPTVAVDASSVIKRKGSVVVLVTSDAPAPVTVAGTANLGKGKKAKLRGKAQTVVPGKVTKFTLNFPRKLKNKLKELARKRSLQLKLTASATDPIGRVTTDTLKTRLKGQAKPASKGRG